MNIRWIVFASLIACGEGHQVCADHEFLSNDGTCHDKDEVTTDPTIPTSGDDDDTDTDTDTLTDTDTDTDTQPQLIVIDVDNLRMGGHFAWDANARVIANGIQQGNPVTSEFYLQFGNAQFDGDWNDTDNYCMVWYELEGYVDQPFAQVEGYPFGFAIPQNNVVGGSTCAPTEFFGFNDVWPQFTNYLWKIELGGTPSAKLEDYLDAVVPPAEHEFYIGGAFPSENFIPGASDAIWFNAYQIDGNFNISNTKLDRVDVLDTGTDTIPPAYYRFGFVNYWVFQ